MVTRGARDEARQARRPDRAAMIEGVDQVTIAFAADADEDMTGDVERVGGPADAAGKRDIQQRERQRQ